MNRTAKILVGPSPHIRARSSTSTLSWGMSALLLPAFCWGLRSFGFGALIPVVSAVLAALLGEAIIGLFSGKITIMDGTAVLTGLLIGLSMPPSIAPYIPVTASIFAVCLVKAAFGGLGANWMNPALAGVVFALLNWPSQMGTWQWPQQMAKVAGVSGATPLGLAHGAFSANNGDMASILLGSAGGSFSDIDKSLTSALNSGVFGFLGSELPFGYIDLLIGNKAGSVGELSGILLLLASIILIAKRIIKAEIPASIIATFGLLVWLFGGLPLGKGLGSGDILFEMLSGSFLLVAFFMATDPVTSPSTWWGRILYGMGIGALTFIIRSFGSKPEGIAFAVIIMNCFVPSVVKAENSWRKKARELRHEKAE